MDGLKYPAGAQAVRRFGERLEGILNIKSFVESVGRQGASLKGSESRRVLTEEHRVRNRVGQDRTRERLGVRVTESAKSPLWIRAPDSESNPRPFRARWVQSGDSSESVSALQNVKRRSAPKWRCARPPAPQAPLRNLLGPRALTANLTRPHHGMPPRHTDRHVRSTE